MTIQQLIERVKSIPTNTAAGQWAAQSIWLDIRELSGKQFGMTNNGTQGGFGVMPT
jgi:hypothetical protein